MSMYVNGVCFLNEGDLIGIASAKQTLEQFAQGGTSSPVSWDAKSWNQIQFHQGIQILCVSLCHVFSVEN